MILQLNRVNIGLRSKIRIENVNATCSDKILVKFDHLNNDKMNTRIGDRIIATFKEIIY